MTTQQLGGAEMTTEPTTAPNVERVAKAIFESVEIGGKRNEWDADWVTDETREYWRVYARAAIAAMEPTVSRSTLINALEEAHLGSPFEGIVEYHVLADAVIAALDCEPEPHVVETVEELESLPEDSAIRDAEGFAFVYSGAGNWSADGRWWQSGQVALPATVLSAQPKPTVSAEQVDIATGHLSAGLAPEAHPEYVRVALTAAFRAAGIEVSDD